VRREGRLVSADVPRPLVHDTDAMLDAAREIVLQGGTRAATVEAIADASGAPSGSIYHRFGSRDELLARLWIRAVVRSQAQFIAAIQHSDPKQAAIGAAMSVLDFCEAHPQDARLLVSNSQRGLLGALPDGPVRDELKGVNRAVEQAVRKLAGRLYGSRARAASERTLLVVWDIPYGAARRHLIADRPFPPGLRGDVGSAVAVVLDRPLPSGHGQ
jgi:AcrR family transcriptional regulator